MNVMGMLQNDSEVVSLPFQMLAKNVNVNAVYSGHNAF
jgi:hypothetical protein